MTQTDSFVRGYRTMDTQPETTASLFVYNRIPTKVSRKDFNRYIDLIYTDLRKTQA